MSEEKTDRSRMAPSSDRLRFVVEASRFNEEKEQKKRLERIQQALAEKPRVAVTIPRIGKILPDLDIEIAGRDIGWGHSQSFDLKATIFDNSDPSNAVSLKMILKESGDEDYLKKLGYLIRCRVIERGSDPAAIDPMHPNFFPEGSFNILVSKTGVLTDLNHLKTRPKIAALSDELTSIEFSRGTVVSLIEEEPSESARDSAARTADRVIELVHRELDSSPSR